MSPNGNQCLSDSFNTTARSRSAASTHHRLDARDAIAPIDPDEIGDHLEPTYTTASFVVAGLASINESYFLRAFAPSRLLTLLASPLVLNPFLLLEHTSSLAVAASSLAASSLAFYSATTMSSSPFARYGPLPSLDHELPLPEQPAEHLLKNPPQEPLTQEPLNHITTPPRRIRRPNSRFLIDTPGHRADSASLPLTRPPPRPRIRPRWERRQKPPKPPAPPPLAPSPDNEADIVVINGIGTCKRRAQDTELDLVASAKDIKDLGSPIVIHRKGQIVSIEDSDQDVQASDHMRWNIPILAFWTRMISSVYTAVSGLTGRIGRWISPKSYEVAEFRSYLNDHQVINKRVKLSCDEEDAQIRWIDRNALSDLIDDYKAFAKGIGKVWESIESHNSRQQMNKALEPLRYSLADNDNDRALLNTTDGHDLCQLFSLQFKRAFDALDNVYEIGVIVKIRDTNELVPPTLDYKLTPQGLDTMNSIKTFLSAPALPTICKEVLQITNKNHLQISKSFIDQIILDLEAITHNIPAPSYVLSSQFRHKLQQTFPPPKRTDLDTHLLLPGAFPDVEEPQQAQAQTKPKPTPVYQPDKVPSPVLQPPEYFPPVISRPKYYKTDFLRADFLEASIAQITPEEYHERFYHESEEHRIIKGNYITEFSPKVPLTPRSQVGLDVPRILEKKEEPAQTKKIEFDDTKTQPPQINRFRDDSPETQIEKDFKTRLLNEDEVLEWSKVHSRRSSQIFRFHEKEDPISPSVRIDELFAIPSIKPLEISDDSKAGIAIRKEQAALKAAEEARRVAEAARRAAEEKARRELEERLASSGGLRVPTQTLVTAVPAAWQTRAQDTLRVAGTTTLATTGEGVDLRRHDFAKVVPATEWLNDEIVNGSLNWLDQAVNSAAGIKDVKRNTRKCLAMSSFFFKRLQDQGVTRTQRTLRRYGVEKKNLLDVDTILVPICERSHWTLLVIRPSKRTVAHMDSLNPRGNAANTNLGLAWMKDVLEEEFQEAEWKVMRHEAPMQTNGYDCGVHTITNAMCLALGLSPIDSYVAEDMPEQRIRLACMLLNGGFKGEFDLRVY
ncbi:hypothetical protein G7Z17_g12254 [Cylindrodendrum hubeiense]|uniref:Ubiquitin-like protease family profile domain-containing protein n=1 Tax=Cylindrodendrum hubeiense TaxID=595255 RepID=A0A9P5GZA9_9HYPO|nr:hypothetical protein G7Z17_g12254 [Cylindrodendrum hubeiense]